MGKVKLKPYKVYLSEEEHQSVTEKARHLGLNFSAYARFDLTGKKPPSETALRQALAASLPRLVNIVNELPDDSEQKRNLIEMEESLWQLLK